MSTKCFKIRYYLQSLQARSAPLFSNVKAYLINDSGKRLISQIHSARDKKVVFQAIFEEQRCKIVYDSESRKYEDKNITILFQFGAEDRFIKMGQVHINIANLLNNNKNAQVLPYKIEKCYDRNARILLGVTFQSMKSIQQKELKLQQISHSRSQCLIPPPRIKMRTIHEKDNFYTTQYSQFTDREDKQQQLSEVSHNKFNPNVARTLNKTQIFKKNSNVITHNQEIIDLKTQNRIYQHQIAQIQLREREMAEETEHLKQFVNKYKNDNNRLLNELDQVKKQLSQKDISRQSLREQLNADISRTLKLYQESQQQRNKLLIQRDREISEEKNLIKDLEKKLAEEKIRGKGLEKSEQGLKRKIQEYMAQIAIYQKALKSEQKAKQKLSQALQSHQRQKEALESQYSSLKAAMQKLKKQKQQSQSELQISHFSLQQMKRQILQFKRTNKELAQKITYFQGELKSTSQMMKLERSNFTRRLQQIEHQAELEQQNRQAYLQEIQVKTINEYSKNNHISMLKKEINKLKYQSSHKGQRVDELQTKISDLRRTNNQLQTKMQDYQHKIVQISRIKALLENQLALYQEKDQHEPNVIQKGFTEKQREELINLCYQQRDQFWKKQIQQIQKDTKLLIEKMKKEKEENLLKLKKSSEEYGACQQNLKKTKLGLKDLMQQEEKMKKASKQLEDKVLQVEKQKNELLTQNEKYQIRIKQLQKKLLETKQLDEALTKAEQDIIKHKNDVEAIKSDYEKEKTKNKKIRTQLKEIVNTACSYLSKSEKQRIFYDELKGQYVDAELLLSFNSAAKIFCDKHNKIRTKLQQLQDMKRQLQQKDEQYQKVNKSLRQQRKSRGSCDSHSSINQSMTQSTTKFIPLYRNPISRVNTTQKQEYEVRTLKLDIDQLKSKLKRQSNRYNELEKEMSKLKQSLEEKEALINKIKEQSEESEEKLVEYKEKLKLKEKQLQSSKEQVKGMSEQVYNLKKQLEQANRTLKQQKSQQILKRTSIRPFHSQHEKGMDQSFLKTFQLQKKLKSTQDELERLKRQTKNDKNDSTHSREIKVLQSRLKEKQQTIISLRETLEDERQKTQQLKELHLLKVRKLKQQFEEEMEAKNKLQKQLTQSLDEKQQKLRQVQKKLKVNEQNLKSANSQLAIFAQKEDKAKKMLISQFQLKIKVMQGDYQTEIININKKIDEYKLLDRTAKESQRRKEREIAQLKIDLEKNQRTIGQLTDKLQLCGVRLMNMEQQQNNFKGVIEALQSKIKIETVEDRKNEFECDKEGFETRSNFSIKTFTFR